VRSRRHDLVRIRPDPDDVQPSVVELRRERIEQPEQLEARCAAFFGEPEGGWRAEHILFSSGQAALANLLLCLGEETSAKLEVAHAGAYFETRELVDRIGAHVASATEARCVIVEPIACDGRFSTHDANAVASKLCSGQTLIVDETLSAPFSQISEVLKAVANKDVAVIRLVSGLKLLQQGLELANVGIVSVHAQAKARCEALAAQLRRMRTLTGAGLRLADALALEAPFFLDLDQTRAYAQRVFAHNRALERAVRRRNLVFKPLVDVDQRRVGKPYCAFELARDNTAAALEAIAAKIEREAKRRRLLIERGGSFGFRGHRYEVIEPETGDPSFLRVALGARREYSCAGLIDLIASIAAGAI